jgi:hypothetical protein
MAAVSKLWEGVLHPQLLLDPKIARQVFSDLFAPLRGKLSHHDLSVYSAVQKLLYIWYYRRRRHNDRALRNIDLEDGVISPTSFFGGYNMPR